MSFFISAAHAQQAAPAAASPMFNLIFIGGMFVLFYLVLWRPQSKRAKEHRELVSSLAKGDEVLTSGGLLGKVTKLAEGTVSVEIAAGVEVMARGLEFRDEIRVVIDFAVEDNGDGFVFVEERLLAGGDVDDRQAAVAQPHPRRGPHAKAVWSAVCNGIAHPLNPGRVDRLGCREVEYPGESAHWPTL